MKKIKNRTIELPLDVAKRMHKEGGAGSELAKEFYNIKDLISQGSAKVLDWLIDDEDWLDGDCDAFRK